MSWTKAACIRALKTVMQTALATIGSAAVFEEIDWKVVLAASILAGLLSLVTSIKGLPEVNDEMECEDGEEGDIDE